MTSKLRTNETNFETMNVTVVFNTLPKELQQYLRAVLYNKTDCYKWEGKPDWDKLETSTIGFQVYKDYYKSIDIYYLAKDNFYSSVGFGKIYSHGIELDNYTNVIYDIDTITEQLDNILTDKTVMHDYDREQFNDALACGDFELAEDIVGDRDIFEFI